jgi:integrase
MTAYEHAIAGQPLPIGAAKTRPGTMRALAVSYFQSLAFRQMGDRTQRVYRNIIERFCDDAGKSGVKHGDLPAAGLQRVHIVKLMAARADKPEAANMLHKALRAMMQHAVEIGLRADDPTREVKALRVKSDGFHSWSDTEIARFEAHHPVGTLARLAFALGLYTGQRRGDVVRMGRQHVRDGFIAVKQEKTGEPLEIEIHPALADIIAATPNSHLTFLTTAFGKPYTSNGFGNWFRDRCNEAGLPHCSFHGLRKAAARRLAEAGCTPHEIAAITVTVA